MVSGSVHARRGSALSTAQQPFGCGKTRGEQEGSGTNVGGTQSNPPASELKTKGDVVALQRHAGALWPQTPRGPCAFPLTCHCAPTSLWARQHGDRRATPQLRCWELSPLTDTRPVLRGPGAYTTRLNHTPEPHAYAATDPEPSNGHEKVAIKEK